MRAATPRPRLLLKHFSLHQPRQLDATALRTLVRLLPPRSLFGAYRFPAAVSRNVALGAILRIR
jgi:hypothetical protein